MSSARNFQPMNTSAVITFVVVAGLVWGGFALILVTAVRRERRKRANQG
jgi:hypothetical protein